MARIWIIVNALWLLFLAVASGNPRLSPRQSLQDLAKVKGGIFVKNGNQTTCGLGFIDNKAAFVSADCLDYDGQTVKMSTNYEVYVDSAFTGSSEHYSVTNVTVHPSYNPQTRANNIAILEFNDNANVSWYNYNAIAPSKWSTLVYVQRYLTDVSTATWGTPKLLTKGIGAVSTCTDMSPLFSANKNDMMCDQVVADSPSDTLSQCKVPYPAIYVMFNGILYQAGIFNYAVITDDDSLCNDNSAPAYYTLLGNYIAFAYTTLNRTVYYLKVDNTSKPQTDPGYAMDDASDSDSRHIQLGGDFYARQGGVLSSESNGANPDDKPSSGGLSKTATIIVAVCSAVGGLMLAVALYFAIRWWRAHIRRARDPLKETNAQELFDELPGTTIPGHGRESRLLSGGFEEMPPEYPYGEQQLPSQHHSVVEQAPVHSPTTPVFNSEKKGQ
ncbi:hypothetical protein H4S02_000424 [Coemansia sp. RSA 2611]|nr:hypothetical protein H4S01_003738 [Coemansia sp. RSA 2610]KAJ2393074.1 hypothetical protein H4S02_000424 [Coemansia sp. RSA 2611]